MPCHAANRRETRSRVDFQLSVYSRFWKDSNRLGWAGQSGSGFGVMGHRCGPEFCDPGIFAVTAAMKVARRRASQGRAQLSENSQVVDRVPASNRQAMRCSRDARPLDDLENML